MAIGSVQEIKNKAAWLHASTLTAFTALCGRVLAALHSAAGLTSQDPRRTLTLLLKDVRMLPVKLLQLGSGP